MRSDLDRLTLFRLTSICIRYQWSIDLWSTCTFVSKASLPQGVAPFSSMPGYILKDLNRVQKDKEKAAVTHNSRQEDGQIGILDEMVYI